MNQRTEIIIKINEAADQFYDKAQDLGTLATEAFRGSEEKHRSQMTGLENIAETTLKVSDVLDYIKRQTARQEGWKRPYDRKLLGEILGRAQESQVQEYTGRCFGEILKNYLENDLEKVRGEICNSLGINGEQNMRVRQQIYLHLIRQFIRQLVVHYEYLADEKKRKPAQEKDREKP